MAIIDFFRQRLSHRKDTEHEQAVIRVVFIGLIGIYVSSHVTAHTQNTPLAELATYTYLAASAVIFGWILLDPKPHNFRRYLSMVFDHGTVSLVLALDGERAAPLYLVYLWVSMGNGLRYGVKALLTSTLMAATGFCFVILTSPFWNSHLPLSFGLLITLLAVPAYAASLVRQLIAAKAAAEQASQTKSRFLATASHELRTPLHAVIGLSDLLQRTKLTAEQTEMVEVVRMSGRTLLTLVEDVLDLTSIQAGKLASHDIEFDLHKNLAEVAAIMRPQVARKGLSLTASVAPEVPYLLHGDWPHVRQILINLITNAIKFTETGSIHIGVRPATENSPYRLAFDITDTGRGIAEADQERIFEAFTQTNMDHPAAQGGVGLGLAIVRQLADLLEGKVSVKSAPGTGSTFTVELPFLPAKSNFAFAEAGHIIALTDNQELAELLVAIPPRVSIVPYPHTPEQLSDNLAAYSSVNRPIVVLIDERDKSEKEILELTQTIAESLKTVAASMVLIKAPRAVSGNSYGGIFATEVTYPPDSVSLMATIHAGFALAHRRDVLNALAVPNGPDLSKTALSNDWAGPVAETGKKILVVEDSPVNRMVTSKILRSAGYEVVLAEGADDALEIMGEQEFDVILMDLNLPGTNGIEIIKLYRVIRMGAQLPPIGIFSADVTEEAQRQCRELGIDLFLPKPIEPDVLIARMRELLPANEPETQPTRLQNSVTSIAEHPRYKATPELNVLDRQTLQSLAALDPDPAFIAELMDTFEKDAAGILIEIDAAVRNNDMRAFWDLIHAMRSSAANVGAKQIYATCLDINAQGKMSFQSRGPEYAARLRHNFIKFSRLVHRVFAVKVAKTAEIVRG